MDKNIKEIVSQAEANKRKREKEKHWDRSEIFRNDAHTKEGERLAVECWTPDITAAAKECDPLFMRVERLGWAQLGCGQIITEYKTLRAHLVEISNGLTWLAQLTDADFAESSRDGMPLDVQLDYFAAELRNRIYKSGSAQSMRRVHGQLEQWIKDNRRGLSIGPVEEATVNPVPAPRTDNGTEIRVISNYTH